MPARLCHPAAGPERNAERRRRLGYFLASITKGAVCSDARRDRPDHEREHTGKEAEAEVAVFTEAVENRDERDSTGRYIFDGGLAGQLEGSGITVVPDANIPTNLGAGTNETIMILGAFREGAYFFSRTPLVVEASRDAGWVSDETVYRGVERYGFQVVRPQGFELLTGITP